MIDLYRKYRSRLRDGDVLEWSSDAVIGRIIQIGTRSDVNHTSGVIWIRDRVFTVEASGFDVHLTYLSRALESCKKRLYWLSLKPQYDHLRQTIVDAQMDMIGVPYDYESLFKSLVCRVSTSVEKLFCSELIGASLEKAGVIPKQKKALWPGEFERLGVFLPRVRIF